MNASARAHGFTLLEVLIAITLLALLIAMAFGTLRGAVATTLPFAMVDTLLLSLEFESVRRSTVEFAKLVRRRRK